MSTPSAAFTPEQMALLLEENEQLREENKELRRMLFGSKRERFVPKVDKAQLSKPRIRLNLQQKSGQKIRLLKV